MAHAAVVASLSRQEMTIDEWARLPEDEPGELVEGYLESEEMPDLVHETIVCWLIRVLGAWIVERGGFVFGSEARFARSHRRGREPRAALFPPPGEPRPRPGAVRVPPAAA